EHRRAGAAMGATRIADVGTRLADVVAELGRSDALEILERHVRLRVVRGRARLREDQALVLLVARVAGRARGIRVGPGRARARVRGDLGVRRAADAVVPAGCD